MKNKKIVIGIIVCLLLVTAIFTIVHLSTRDAAVENAITVEIDGASKAVELGKLSTGPVEGTVVNGKGEEKTISGNGILLKDLIATVSDSQVSNVTVTADDEYSADVSGDEVSEDAKVYILIENGQANMVVFGDQNSKRNVTNVVKIMVE